MFETKRVRRSSQREPRRRLTLGSNPGYYTVEGGAKNKLVC